jgi:transposase
VIELARAGTRVSQLSVTFGMTEATIYNWLKQDRVDRGEVPGLSTEQQLDLAAARRRIRQLETELAVARKVNEVFLREGISPKALPGDCCTDRAGHQRSPCLHGTGDL